MIYRLLDDTKHGAPRRPPAREDTASEAWPARRYFEPEPFRAAYWRADNRSSGGLLLTDRRHTAMPPALLIRAAQEEAARVGLLLGGGTIIIVSDDGKYEHGTR